MQIDAEIDANITIFYHMPASIKYEILSVN